MDIDLDFDTSLLEYPAKMDDLPYLDFFHDDKLDFGEDRQDCTEPGDAGSPDHVLDCLLNPSEDVPFTNTAKPDTGKDTKTKATKRQRRRKADEKDPKEKEAKVAVTKKKKKKDAKETNIAKEDAKEGNTETEAPQRNLRRSTREYNLRQSSLINRIETETRRAKPREPKPKAKPPPLSKYRRRTANSRERTRMAEINDAFEVLRQAIPNYPEETNSKQTKINTLRMALNYIAALREMLGYPDSPASASDTDSTSTSISSPDTVSEKQGNTPSTSTSDGNNCVTNCATDSVSSPMKCVSPMDCMSPTMSLSPNCVSLSPTMSLSPPMSMSPNMNCLSPDSLNCASPSVSMTCSSPGSSISDIPYFNLPYIGLNNPLDSEGESIGSLS